MQDSAAGALANLLARCSPSNGHSLLTVTCVVVGAGEPLDSWIWSFSVGVSVADTGARYTFVQPSKYEVNLAMITRKGEFVLVWSTSIAVEPASATPTAALPRKQHSHSPPQLPPPTPVPTRSAQ